MTGVETVPHGAVQRGLRFSPIQRRFEGGDYRPFEGRG